MRKQHITLEGRSGEATGDSLESPVPIKLRFYWPVPVRLTNCGLPPPLSAIETEALRAPIAVGVKVTVIVQLPPPTTLVPQVLVCMKSPGLVPVRVIPVIVRVCAPTLVRVTVCGALVVPTVTVPNGRMVGDSLTTVPTPDTAMV